METEITGFQNRRNFVKNVAGLGTSIGVGTKMLRGGDSKVEIVTHRSDGNIVKTKRVPADWHDHSAHVYNVLEQSAEDYLSLSGVSAISAHSPKEPNNVTPTFAGKSGFCIRIFATSNSVRDEIPSKIQNVDMLVDLGPAADYMAQCHNSWSFSSVRGNIEINEGSPDGTYGTSGCITYDKVYDRPLMLTVLHVVGDKCDSTSSIGNTVTQNGSGLGEVEKADDTQDVAFIKNTSSSKNFSDYILRSDTGNDVPVEGYVTEEGCKDLASDSITVYKSGIATGTIKDAMTDVYYYPDDVYYNCDGSQDYYGHAVGTDHRIIGGDSGGPIHDISSGDAYMIGLNSLGDGDLHWQDPCNTGTKYRERQDTFGPSAYKIKDRFPSISFSGPS